MIFFCPFLLIDWVFHLLSGAPGIQGPPGVVGAKGEPGDHGPIGAQGAFTRC